MTLLEIRTKRLYPDALPPQYSTGRAACFDLFAHNCVEFPVAGPFELQPGVALTFGTGCAFEIPADHVMLVFSRSGHGFKQAIRLANCVGVIDSDYRGEVRVKLTRDSSEGYAAIRLGDRIAQALILPIPRVEFKLVNDLLKTERGSGGFGSTGA